MLLYLREIIFSLNYFCSVVLAELVETEEEFGQDIQEVVERYFNPLETNPAPRIVRDNKDLIFNNLKQISQFHNTYVVYNIYQHIICVKKINF